MRQNAYTCKTQLGEKDTEGAFIAKLNDKSELMEPHREHYGRLSDGHSGRNSQFMSDFMGK